MTAAAAAVSFTNFGPYHLARLRALARALGRSGSRLIAYETAGTQGLYPWETPRGDEPFEWVTLLPGRALEDVAAAEAASAMRTALRRDRPGVVVAAGYSRPECMAMAKWARSTGQPAVLMSESQERDHPRVWWKEAVKRRRVRRFDAGLVGGPRHSRYLESLGMPADRISLGYNAVDADAFAAAAEAARRDPSARVGLPAAPYFLAVSRFVPEKNLGRLVRAYADYRRASSDGPAWDLALCGDGPNAAAVESAVGSSGYTDSIHRPGFLQADGLARWYAHAGAFVHPSLLEPWGLVVNEAAACGLPLVVSDRSGCVETFVPDGPGRSTGRRVDAHDQDALADALAWIAALPEVERQAMGRRAAAIAREWGPERFAAGAVEAILTAGAAGPRRTSRDRVRSADGPS